MRLCRYDDDRLGVVRGDMVHDVTEAQTQIRAAAPYAMKGDAVIGLPPGARLEEMRRRRRASRSRRSSCCAGGAASKLVAAPTNYKAHIEEMARGDQSISHPAIGTAGLFWANSSLVGPPRAWRSASRAAQRA
jgi:hypothetical protein